MPFLFALFRASGAQLLESRDRPQAATCEPNGQTNHWKSWDTPLPDRLTCPRGRAQPLGLLKRQKQFSALSLRGACSFLFALFSASGVHHARAESGHRQPRVNRVTKLTIGKAGAHHSSTACLVREPRTTPRSPGLPKPYFRIWLIWSPPPQPTPPRALRSFWRRSLKSCERPQAAE